MRASRSSSPRMRRRPPTSPASSIGASCRTCARRSRCSYRRSRRSSSTATSGSRAWRRARTPHPGPGRAPLSRARRDDPRHRDREDVVRRRDRRRGRARHERPAALRHGGGHRSAGRRRARARDARRDRIPTLLEAHRSDRARLTQALQPNTSANARWFALVSRVPSTANTTSVNALANSPVEERRERSVRRAPDRCRTRRRPTRRARGARSRGARRSRARARRGCAARARHRRRRTSSAGAARSRSAPRAVITEREHRRVEPAAVVVAEERHVRRVEREVEVQRRAEALVARRSTSGCVSRHG